MADHLREGTQVTAIRDLLDRRYRDMLAAAFAPTTTTEGNTMTDQPDNEEDELREYVRQIFAPDEDDDDPGEPEARIPNHVPSEGQTPTPPPEDPMRQFARDLFDN
jgi:hypothetical protein